MSKKIKQAKNKASNPINTPIAKSNKWVGLAIALIAFLIYANTLAHDYCLDDFSAIKENRFVKQGLSSTSTLVTTHYRAGYWNSKGTLYRPLSLVMFAGEWGLAPDNAKLSHFVNVLFFAWTGWLLFQFLSLLLDKKYFGLVFLVSLIFVTHPIHTEVVANIKSRDEIMAFFLGLAGLYYFVKFYDHRKILSLILSILFYTLALFSKESAITWLAIYPLTILFFRKANFSKVAVWSALFVVPTAVFLLIRHNILGTIASVKPDIVDNFFTTAEDITSGQYYGSALYMVFEYFKALVLPFNLVSEKGYNQIPLMGLGSFGAIFAILVILASTFIIFRALRQKSDLLKIIAYGLLLFGISFSIYSNLIVEIGSSYAERFLYMPSLGFAMIVGTGLFWLAQKLGKGKNISFSNPAIIIGLAISLLFSVLTINRNKAWYDSATLYATDVLKSPNSAKLNYHHGLEIGKKGNKLKGNAQINQYKEALSFFQKAIKINPKYSDAYGQVGLYYYRLKDYDNALKNYLIATKLKPNANAYSNMGIIYFQRGDLKNAEKVYKLALKYEPSFIDAYRNLGAVYGSTKRYKLAIEQFKKGLTYDPNNKILKQYLASAQKDLRNQQASGQ